MNIWVWIAIFIAAWLLEALASAAKNKQRRQEEQQQRERGPQGIARAPVQPQRVPPPAVQRRPPPPLQASRPIQPARTVFVPSLQSAPPITLEGLVARPPRVREVEGTTATEGISAEVEVTEAAPESTDVSHQRVTEKYRAAAPLAGEIGGPEHVRAQARFALRPRTARDAIVWMEILGPPKSERV